LPREFDSGSKVHRYFQEWTESGVFGKACRPTTSGHNRQQPQRQASWFRHDG